MEEIVGLAAVVPKIVEVVVSNNRSSCIAGPFSCEFQASYSAGIRIADIV